MNSRGVSVVERHGTRDEEKNTNEPKTKSAEGIDEGKRLHET
jgi:hypothetical protein